MNVVLKGTSLLLLTVTDVSTTCAEVIFSVKVSCITSVDGVTLWLLIGQLCRNVIGHLSVKVTRPSFFGGVPSYFEALWYPHLYFYRKSNT